MLIDNWQIPYMAGIVDGEGCIYVNRRKASGRRKTPGYGVKVVISITNQQIVEWMKVNMSLTSIHYHQPEGNRKPVWSCTWNNSAAETLLTKIQPYSIIKSKQIGLGLILLQHLRLSRKGGYGIVTPETDVQFRENIKLEISKLNKRGKLKE
jgi:hypothetical protein